MRGIGAAGSEITAVLEGSGAELSGASIACRGCHGADGRGKPEGGVTPSNIRWEVLIRPYATAGRAHPPYNERSLLRAIAMGVDPAGNALARTMPRFRLTRSDMADLIAWLKKIGSRVGSWPDAGQYHDWNPAAIQHPFPRLGQSDPRSDVRKSLGGEPQKWYVRTQTGIARSRTSGERRRCCCCSPRIPHEDGGIRGGQSVFRGRRQGTLCPA